MLYIDYAVKMSENPFAALLQDVALPQTVLTDYKTEEIENIFGFTLNKSKNDHFIYLEDVAILFDLLNLEVLEHALFERILLPNPESLVSSSAKSSMPKEFYESNVIAYLYNCFKKAAELKDEEFKSIIEELILRNIVTALKQPILYEKQDLHSQLYDILKSVESLANSLFIKTYLRFCEEEDATSVQEPFTKILKMIHVDIARASPVTFPDYIFVILSNYVKYEELALILLDYCQPKNLNVGMEYSNTLLGALFSVSILPKTPNGNYEFFQDAIDQASNSALEGILWTNVNRISQEIHMLILNLLKCSPAVKSAVLKWFGNCLKANVDRGKLWNAQAPEYNPTNFATVSDGFMINFGNVLMRLCQPFCSNINDGKILKVDPTYCAVRNNDCLKKEIHLLDMSLETCLLPTESDNDYELERPTSTHYSFVTECFFMGHRAFELGFRVAVDKLVRLNQEMSRLEHVYQDAVNRANSMPQFLENIKQTMSSELSKYLTIKCAMSEPNLLQAFYNFMSATAFWLSQVAVHTHNMMSPSYAPLDIKIVKFPLPEVIPDTLKCIPEYVVENVVCYLIFLRRFNPKMFEEEGYERMKPILTFILIFMGSSDHTRNPHLRAHLAEALEALLPYHKDEPPSLNTMGGHQRERLFIEHHHRKEIVKILLNVFVGIEMTGQSVQFEQKFNYRRPMYLIMDYLWEMTEYQEQFKQLAEEAERNMEAVLPPLFLRFVNLLINDAIFLLDESLTNMAKLREMQTARESGEWERLPLQERAQNMGYMQHIGMLAKFDNILGRDTIRTLKCLTSHITIVFIHNTMVDRMAAMLNYFLLNLVGPNQKNFKVKDQKEYSFEPAATVLDICQIYVNLKESDAFCFAISQDGRSYSPQLFSLAEDVLVRIGGGTLIGELQDVAKKVANKMDEFQSNEEALAEAPEHFLDPIMSTLMTDPVILPSSKQTVDRSTIARHLLSDQTDPFNRAPLFMDQVIPHTELANEIKEWMEARKLKR